MVNGSFTFWTVKYVRNNIEDPVDRFRLRRNNYMENDRKFLRGEEIKQRSLSGHFLKDNHHAIEDVSICLVNKTDPSDPLKGACITGWGLLKQ